LAGGAKSKVNLIWLLEAFNLRRCLMAPKGLSDSKLLPDTSTFYKYLNFYNPLIVDNPLSGIEILRKACLALLKVLPIW